MLSGSLAPPLLPGNDAMDLIFASHWIYPAKAPVLQEMDVKCLEKKLKQAIAGKRQGQKWTWKGSNSSEFKAPAFFPDIFSNSGLQLNGKVMKNAMCLLTIVIVSGIAGM